MVVTLTALPTHLRAEAPFIEVSNKAGKSFEARIIALNDDAVTVKTRDEKEYKLQLELLSDETVERVQNWKPFGSLKIDRISAEEGIADPFATSRHDFSKPLLSLTFDGIDPSAFLIDPDDLYGFEFLKSGLEKFIEIYPDLAKAIPFPPNQQRKLLLEDNKKKSKPISTDVFSFQQYEDNRSAFYVIFKGDTIGLSWSISMLNTPDDSWGGYRHFGEVSDIFKVYQLRDILKDIDPAQELRKLERQSIELDRLIK